MWQSIVFIFANLQVKKQTTTTKTLTEQTLSGPLFSDLLIKTKMEEFKFKIDIAYCPCICQPSHYPYTNIFINVNYFYLSFARLALQ